MNKIKVSPNNKEAHHNDKIACTHIRLDNKYRGLFTSVVHGDMNCFVNRNSQPVSDLISFRKTTLSNIRYAKLRRSRV